ncbi:MAG: Hpt domain-containing protein, partial [Acidobacteriota bacterium]|nr:Hpt domain-containing protein [Acidobacteriota bacterium]
AESLPATLARLKGIDGLEVDSALEAVGGIYEVYEQAVKLTARLLPETIGKIDRYVTEENVKQFAIEVHGLKSVLRNIGAAALGRGAAQLESAALERNAAHYHDAYPAFKQALLGLTEQLNAAIADEPAAAKKTIDKETLVSALKTAKPAIEGFDAMQALDTLSPLSEYSYTEEADGLLKQVIFALEEFNCEGALTNILKLEGLLT